MAAVWFIVLTTLSNMSELQCGILLAGVLAVISRYLCLCVSAIQSVDAARHNAQSVSNLPITTQCVLSQCLHPYFTLNLWLGMKDLT